MHHNRTETLPSAGMLHRTKWPCSLGVHCTPTMTAVPFPRSTLDRALVVVVAAVLVAGVVTAFAQSGSSTSTKAAESSSSGPTGLSVQPGSTTPLSLGARGTLPPTVVSGPSGASGGSRPTSPPPTLAVQPLPTVAGPVGNPGQPAATHPGTYLYSVSSSGGEGSYSGTMTEVVTTTSSSGGSTDQMVVDTEPTGSAGTPPSPVGPPTTAGGSSSQETTTQNVDWDAQGYFQLATTIDADGQNIHCAWSPPVTELPVPLAVGRKWVIAGSCHVTVYGQQGTITLSGQGMVTGQQQVKVGTNSVAVWVVSDSYNAVIRVPSFGVTFTLTNAATDRVAPSLGLLVEEDATETFQSGSERGSTVTHQALRSIYPT